MMLFTIGLSEVAILVMKLYIDLHYLVGSAVYNHRAGVFRVCECISIHMVGDRIAVILVSQSNVLVYMEVIYRICYQLRFI